MVAVIYYTFNCSYTGLGLGLKFRHPVDPNTRLCGTETYCELFLRGTEILGFRYVYEFRYSNRVRYKSTIDCIIQPTWTAVMVNDNAANGFIRALFQRLTIGLHQIAICFLLIRRLHAGSCSMENFHFFVKKSYSQLLLYRTEVGLGLRFRVRYIRIPD